MRAPYGYKVFIFIIIAILLLIDNTNLAKADNYDSYEYPGYECHYFSKREIRELIELIEAKCYSKPEIIDLITENPCKNGHPSSTYIFCLDRLNLLLKLVGPKTDFFSKSCKIIIHLHLFFF